MQRRDSDRAAEHLQPRVRFGEGSEKLRDAFSVPPQDAVLNVLQREHFPSDQVAHIVKELQGGTQNSRFNYNLIFNIHNKGHSCCLQAVVSGVLLCISATCWWVRPCVGSRG